MLSTTPVMNFERAGQYLKDLKVVFDEADIEFFLFFGTLLGAVRDKDFITHDHDMDVAILGKDAAAVEALAPKFKELGYTLHWANRLKSSGKLASFYIAKPGFKEKIDIYTLFLFRGVRWWVRHGFGKDGEHLANAIPFPEEYFIRPHSLNFKGDKYTVPRSPEKFLSYLWWDWKTPHGGQIGDRVFSVKFLENEFIDEENTNGL